MEHIATHHETPHRLRVLAVIDEGPLLNLVAMSLRYDGWEVAVVSDPDAVLERVEDFDPSVIVVDVQDGYGPELLVPLRSSGSLVPVLFLLDPDAATGRRNGLTAGGNDVLVKPFSVEDLAASLRALVRRVGVLRDEVVDPRLVLGDLVLDEDTHEVFRGGVPIQLTTTEFDLLRYLLRHPGQLITKDQLLDRVWHYDFEGKSTVAELYVSYLRKKLDTGRPRMIHTVRGAGYLIRSANAGR